VSLQRKGDEIDFDNWTLHEQATDFSESVDVAARHPERLRELVEAFDKAAWSNMVYPLDNRNAIQKFNQIPPHLRPPEKGSRRFLPGGQTVNRALVIPLIADRHFRITANIEHHAADEGVLFAIGEVFGGLMLCIEAGELRMVYNGFGEYTRLAPVRAPVGKHALTFDFEALGKRRGRGRLLIDGQPAIASGDWTDCSPTLMGGFHEGLDIGLDRRAPVDWALYQRRGIFRYSGSIHDVIIDSNDFAPGSAYAKG
jgi:arylsulfatase